MLKSLVTTVATAVEVRAAAVGALERLGHPGHRHGRGEAGRIDLLDRRREQVVDADLSGELGVALGISRIRVEVGRRR